MTSVSHEELVNFPGLRLEALAHLAEGRGLELAHVLPGIQVMFGGHTHQGGAGFFHPHERAWNAMTPEDQRAVNDAYANIGKALAAYQHRLVTGPSPFDRFEQSATDGCALVVHDRHGCARRRARCRTRSRCFLDIARSDGGSVTNHDGTRTIGT